MTEENLKKKQKKRQKIPHVNTRVNVDLERKLHDYTKQ